MLAATLGHTDIVTKQMELGVCSKVNSAELAYFHQVRRWQPWTREVVRVASRANLGGQAPEVTVHEGQLLRTGFLW